MISSGAVTDYAWDNRNRLTSVTERASAAGPALRITTYKYDALDRRIAKLYDSNGDGNSDRTDAWVWDGAHEILQYRDSDGVGAAQSFRLTNRYLWGDAIDQLLADEQYTGNTGPVVFSAASATAGNTLWALADQLGSVRDLVDNNGVIRQHVVYDGFGRRVREVDYNASGVQIANNDPSAIDELFGYTGRDWDSDTQLQYNRARWYDPATGRWLSQDPIGFSAGDANLYRYVGNGSTGATDPSGLVDRTPEGVARGKGHHIIPWSLWAKEGFSTDVQDFLNDTDGTSGARLASDFYTAHNGATIKGVSENEYREAVTKIYSDWYSSLGGNKPTKEDAKALLRNVIDAKESTPALQIYLSGVEDEIAKAEIAAKQYLKEKGSTWDRASKEMRKEATDSAKNTIFKYREKVKLQIKGLKRAPGLLGLGFSIFGASQTVADDGLNAATVGRLLADLTPLQWSNMGTDALSAAYDEMKRELEPTTSGREWIRKSQVPQNSCNKIPTDKDNFPIFQRRGFQYNR